MVAGRLLDGRNPRWPATDETAPRHTPWGGTFGGRGTIGDGTGTPECGEIAIGRVVTLGDTLEGTEIGMDSFSRKEQDEYGDWVIVPRSKSDPTDFLFAITPSNAGRVRSRLAARRDLATVYFADESLISYGAIAYGYFEKFRIPLSYQGKSIVRLEIQALT